MPTHIEEYQIEMLWRCNACQAENKGRDKECRLCRKPLDKEEFYFPQDTSENAAVTDPEQLRHALAGEDWKCKYCGSKQRDLDGSCRNCIAEKKTTCEKFCRGCDVCTVDTLERNTIAPATKPAGPQAFRRGKFRKLLTIAAAVVGSILVIGLLISLLSPKEFDAKVSQLYWQNTIFVDRNQVMQHSGWNPGADAFDIEDLGRKIHHHDKVKVGTRTVQYQDTVSDGQDCHRTPTRTVSDGCSSNKNGYATCRKKTVGGDLICHPRYKKVWKTKEQDIYEDVPVYRDWYAWKSWDWVTNRQVSASGSDANPYWPSEQEISLNAGCVASRPQCETIRRASRFSITFTDSDGDTWRHETEDLSDFQRFRVGSQHHLKVTLGRVEVIQ